MFVVYLSFSPSGDTIPLTDRRILALRWWFILLDEDGGSDGEEKIWNYWTGRKSENTKDMKVKEKI